MSAINCLENGSEHRYGLWEEINDGKEGCRTCEKCGFQRILPMSSEVAEQIRKQKEALVFISAFHKVDINDPYIVGYLYTFLDDYINYLSEEHKNALLDMMENIEKSDHINYQNATFISQLSTSLRKNAIEEFYDTFDEFKNFNADMLECILHINEMNDYHR